MKDITRVEVVPKPVTTITTKEQLEAIKNNLSGSYKLGDNIPLTGWSSPINGFTGTLDGDGYVITLTNATASLFETINTGGTVKNLGVNATINAETKVGGIAATNSGTIQRCYVEGSITSTDVYISGIADNQGTIEDCYTTVSITTTGHYAGGIAGGNYKGTIRRCYATGAISSPGSAGIAGAGIDINSIQNCIALNESITGTGAHARVANGSGTLTGNYASPAIAGTWNEIEADKKDGADLTAANFIDQGAGEGPFTTWSGDNWDFGDNTNLPTLKGFKADQPVASITRKSVIPLITTIATAEDLATFRDAVNSGENYKDKTVTLTADITVSGWDSGIGAGYNKPFLGTFDGGGHVITLEEGATASLFVKIGNGGTVRNLGVKAAIVAANEKTPTGGIAEYNAGTIQRCYVEGKIKVAGYNACGVIAGENAGMIENCYSTASIDGYKPGGIMGSNASRGTVRQCYATGAIGSIESYASGGIVGSNDDSIQNCIALNASISSRSFMGRIAGTGNGKLSSNYASPLIPGEWIDNETDTNNGKDLMGSTFIGKGANQGAFTGWTEADWSFGDNTKLPKLNAFAGTQPVDGITREETIHTLITTIGTEQELIDFRSTVNTGSDYTGKTVTLTADITVSDWDSSIGTSIYAAFHGTFDGQGHVIHLTGSRQLFKLLGKQSDSKATIRNLGVKVAIQANDNSSLGGIVETNYGTIEQCYTEGTITSSGTGTSDTSDSRNFRNAGGIAAYNHNSIQNCYSTASVTTDWGNAGGIAAWNYSSIQQCYATGTITGKGRGNNIESGQGSGIAKNYEDFSNIKQCIALNTGIIGDLKWNRITTGEGTLSGNYASPLIPGTWVEKGDNKADGEDLTASTLIGKGADQGAFAGWTETAWNFGDNSKLPKLSGFTGTQPVDDITRTSLIPLIISIASVEDLIAFRNIVEEGENYEGKTVTLTADITVSDWDTGIGSSEKPFCGTFDGAGHVINLTGSTSLFMLLGKYDSGGKGTVQNLGVKVAITTDDDYYSIGGIVATNYGTIKQCYTQGMVLNNNSYSFAGGIVGQNYSIIQDCYSDVDITVQSGAGGIAENNEPGGTIERCYATGTISAEDKLAAGIAGNNSGTVTQCIALNTGITGYSVQRIAGEEGTSLSGNYASPIIEGAWYDRGADKTNGADLTKANFIDSNSAFGDSWTSGSSWSFDDKRTNLPQLKTTGGNVIAGQKSTARVSFLYLFPITSVEDLMDFRDAVNKGESYEDETVTLTTDLTLPAGNWIPIGNDLNQFNGTFEGQGHCISGLNVEINATGAQYGGLFGYTGKYALVKDLGVTTGTVSVTSTDSDAYAGGIVGYSNGTIQNCYTDIAVTATAGNSSYYGYAGGIAGCNSLFIINCYAKGDISASYCAGGIAGANRDSNDGYIAICFATGKVEGEFAGGITAKMKETASCIALNTEGITSTKGNSQYRIGTGSLDKNYASPLIPGEWSDKGADKNDGEDLTEANFIDTNPGEGNPFGTDWNPMDWNFANVSILPKLMTTADADGNRTVINGQSDLSRKDYLDRPVEISTAVTYDPAEHAGKQINILSGGHLTVNAAEPVTLRQVTIEDGGILTVDGEDKKVTFTKLVMQEGGQLFARKAYGITELAAPRTLGNKWTAYGSPVGMEAVAATEQTFYKLKGYEDIDADEQSWGSIKDGTATSYYYYRLNLIATEASNVPVTLTASSSESDPVDIPADVAAPTGSALNTGIFLFHANPTLHEVTIPMAYILSDDGTYFERTENAVVKPFQSYMVANAVTAASVMSLRTGGTPTANEQPALPDNAFRVWGTNGQLHLSADTPCDVTVYSLSGQLLHSFRLDGSRTLAIGRGIYLIHSNNITYKVSL